MSKTREYIEKMKVEKGIDVLSIDNFVDDEYFYAEYLKSLKDMNIIFDENNDKLEQNEK